MMDYLLLHWAAGISTGASRARFLSGRDAVRGLMSHHCGRCWCRIDRQAGRQAARKVLLHVSVQGSVLDSCAAGDSPGAVFGYDFVLSVPVQTGLLFRIFLNWP